MANAMVIVVAKNVAAKKITISDQEAYQKKLLNIPYTSYQLEMLEYAKTNDVPVMQEEGIGFLIMLLKVLRPKRILEIGSAIGYSSSFMALNSDAIIDTIERDQKMFDECQKNHQVLGIDKRINRIFGDALETFDLVKDNQYDLIFIDAAKAQYIKFFELYAPLLKDTGVILSDNLYFHELLFTEVENRDLRQLVRKVDRYNDYLNSLTDYETHIFKIGDGIGVTTKKA